MTVVVIVVAIAVLALVGIAIVRSRTRRPQLAPSVAPLPEVLVEAEAPRPSLEEPGSLRQRLATSRGVFDRLRSITGDALSSEQRDVVEEVLLRSDIGVATTKAVLDELDAGIPLGVAGEVRRILLGFLDRDRGVRLVGDAGRVPVWLFVGVNGVGKTTTIGKLAQLHADEGRQVVLAAGDTFRAAAADQLAQWAERANADIVRATEGADPGSVIHDALGRAAARHADIVLADTAGRRVNNTNLLDELRKVRRVADREPGQVVETLLVLDATTGQNALSQAREFLAAAEVTGIVLTKLDGTARGGIVVAIERELAIPVKYVGVGERVEDLRVFEPESFVDSLLAT